MNPNNPVDRLILRIYLAAKRVYRALGSGHSEAVYHQAMIEELRREKGSPPLRVHDRPRLRVEYQGLLVGRYIPDCIVTLPNAAVIVDFKAVEAADGEKPFAQADFDQMRRYLRLYKRQAVGLLLNFGGTRPVWRRVEAGKIHGKIVVDVTEIDLEA